MSSIDLSSTIKNLKTYQSSRKFKAAGKALIALNRLKAFKSSDSKPPAEGDLGGGAPVAAQEEKESADATPPPPPLPVVVADASTGEA